MGRASISTALGLRDRRYRTGDVVRTDVPSGDVNYDVSFDPPIGCPLLLGRCELWKYVMSADASRRVKTFPARLQSLGGSVDWIDRTGRFMLVAYGDGLHVWDKETDTIYEGTIPVRPPRAGRVSRRMAGT